MVYSCMVHSNSLNEQLSRLLSCLVEVDDTLIVDIHFPLYLSRTCSDLDAVNDGNAQRTELYKMVQEALRGDLVLLRYNVLHDQKFSLSRLFRK